MELHKKSARSLVSVWMGFWLSFTLSSAQIAWAGTALGTLATQMQPRTWVELPTIGLTQNLLEGGVSGSYILQFTDDAQWDPTSRQVLFLGGPHTGRLKFITYGDATNTWRAEPDPPFACTDCIHGYDHNALNPQAGEFYHRFYNSTTVHRYKIATQTWDRLPNIPMSSWQVAGALEFFPERNGLVFVDGEWGVWFFNMGTNQWSHVANTGTANDFPGQQNLPMGPYHNFTEYSPVHKVMIFGGGNGSSDIYTMNASGVITKKGNAPVGLGITQTIITVDPVGGNFLVFSDLRRVYEYNPITDTWTLLSIPTPPFFNLGPDGPVFGTIATPISTYGVVAFVNYDFNLSKVYLYKHSPSGPADTTPPAVPTALQAR